MPGGNGHPSSTNPTEQACPSACLILPVQPAAHIALFYWMLDLRVIDRQSDGLSCEAVQSFNMHNIQQQLNQSVACL
eukprot:superscaffoldBa00000180_g2457